MNKPITVAREDFVKDIITAVQQSGLPAFIIVDVLEGIVRYSKAAAARQYEEDLKAYQQTTADRQEGEENEKEHD